MTAVERDIFEAGALFVGGGVGGLAGAIHLMKLINQHNEEVESGAKEGKLIDTEDEFPVMLIEKATEVGFHNLSGAVINPSVLNELIPDWKEKDCPLTQPVVGDQVLYLTPGGKSLRFPVTPPSFHNEGNYIISIGRFIAWLGEQAEEMGVNVFPGFPGSETLFAEDGTTVTGVRTGDKGIGKDGEHKANYEPGMDIQAKVTVFGEGARGSLTKQIVPKLGLDKDCNPQVYSTGVKELWEVPEGRLIGGRVTHTMGHPLSFEEFGGSFIYELDETHLVIGMVTSLDSPDPYLDPHQKLQELKEHPTIKAMIEGGKMVSYGAKTIPEGGWYSVPKLSFDGGMLIGDSAGFVNVASLKGIHFSMKSGMLAAEAIFQGILNDDYSEKTLGQYDKAVEDSIIGKDLKEWSKFRQGFANWGFLPGMANAIMIEGTKTVLGTPISLVSKNMKPDYAHMKQLKDRPQGKREKPEYKFDGVYTFNKLDDVYHSGTTHEEDQPCHLVIEDYDICNTRCTEEFGNPCEQFCPAAVYEMAPNENDDGKHLIVNFSNCVHCKTCDIRDPYQIINWVTPEGGDGPKYQDL